VVLVLALLVLVLGLMHLLELVVTLALAWIVLMLASMSVLQRCMRKGGSDQPQQQLEQQQQQLKERQQGRKQQEQQEQQVQRQQQRTAVETSCHLLRDHHQGTAVLALLRTLPTPQLQLYLQLSPP
jgi:flagellar biosynthesis/type III secretory pathway M-ring protein FliF/YscJ